MCKLVDKLEDRKVELSMEKATRISTIGLGLALGLAWALMAANISNEMGPLAIFGFFLILSIFLTPIWVFAGLFISKKKTPYILSLCIGLGSLALLIYLQIAFMEGLQRL